MGLFSGKPSNKEKPMKAGIHPEYQVATVTCACGNTFVTRTTVGNLKLDICNECHPFFTGTQKIVDTEGRVDRFMKKYGQAKK
jgi:large subunit ribosomal protein L31